MKLLISIAATITLVIGVVVLDAQATEVGDPYATTTTTDPYASTTTTTTSTTSTTTTTTTPTNRTTSTTTTLPTTTTTPTNRTTSTTTTLPTTTTIPATIDVAAFAPVCQADIPYIDYNIQVTGTSATTATITFSDLDGNVVEVLTDVPLSGRVIYPGASENPQDWPGWMLNEDGFWVTDPSDANLRDGLNITVEVNPTATAQVGYPPETEACNSPENPPSSPPPGTPSTPGAGQPQNSPGPAGLAFTG